MLRKFLGRAKQQLEVICAKIQVRALMIKVRMTALSRGSRFDAVHDHLHREADLSSLRARQPQNSAHPSCFPANFDKQKSKPFFVPLPSDVVRSCC